MSSKVLAELGARIRQLRTGCNEGRGVSQAALALALSVTPNTISRWETGLYEPSLADLEQLAAYFQISLQSLFPGPVVGAIDEMVSLLLQLDEAELQEIKDFALFKLSQRNKQDRPAPGRKRGPEEGAH